MKLGVFNPIFGNLTLEQLLDRLVELGLQAVELRSGPVDKREIAAGRLSEASGGASWTV